MDHMSSNDSRISKENLCRLCLAIDVQGDFLQFGEKLIETLKLLHLRVLQTISKSSKICYSCYEKLNMLIEFRNRIEIIDDILSKYVDNNYIEEKDLILSNIYIRDNSTIEPAVLCNSLINLLKNGRSKCDICSETVAKLEPIKNLLQSHECEVMPDFTLENGFNIDGDNNSFDDHFVNSIKEDDQISETDLHCDQCSEVFYCKKNLARHLKKSHTKSIKKHYRKKSKNNIEKVIDNLDLDFSNQPEEIEATESRGFVSKIRYVCHKCKECFKFMKTLAEHLKDEHNLPLLLQCDLCGKLVKTLYGLKVHKQLHANIKKYSCKICGKGFVLKTQMKSHEKNHTEEKLIACEKCGKKFLTLTLLRVSHLTERRYKCERCAKRFTTEYKLKAHVKRCTAQKNCVCDECGKTFVFRGDLRVHMRTHTKEKPFPCDVCHKTFATHSNRAAHVRVHAGLRSFACPDCPKAFVARSTLKNHRRIHSGEMPYSCGLCSRPFRQRSSLHTHMKVHNLT